MPSAHPVASGPDQSPLPDSATVERLAPWSTAGRKRLPDWISRLVFGKPLAPSEGEWQRAQQSVLKGDPAMDALVHWMFEAGPRQAKPLFEQALYHGIDSVPNPPQPLRDFFAHIDTPPAWLKPDRLVAGAQASHLAGPMAIYVLRDLALMGGYAYFNSMNQTLARTGALSKDIALRLGETGKWLNDVTETGALSRFGAGFITTIRVRLVHALVRRNLLNKPDWELAKWGVPINQVDMLATYLAFGPVTLMGVRMFGVFFRPRQAADILHMWRYIGWLMGVDEDMLARTETDGLRKLHHCFLTHRLPDERIRQLGQALRDEPLSRTLPEQEKHPLLTRIKRRYLYEMHLSNSSLILGPTQRRQLGLRLAILPWYPALSAPFRFLRIGYYQLRGGQPLADFAARCRAGQEQELATYFGDKEPDIIRPDASHPAHTG